MACASTAAARLSDGGRNDGNGRAGLLGESVALRWPLCSRAVQLRRGARALAEAGRQLGPGSYQAQSRLTEQRAPAAIFGHTTSSKFVSADNGVPGPGHYRSMDDANSLRSSVRGTVFYKGDFHPRGGYLRPSADENDGGGPGAHYNDESQYSRSINGDRVCNKGYTMGIRYPARATYQCCPPYDETTNINCVYPDEQTWETQPKLRLPPVHSPKK